MGAAKKITPELKIAEFAKSNASELWGRASRIAVPIGAVGGFCADVLAPLGPIVAYLTILTAALCIISGTIWYGIKRRQIRLALADGHIDEAEFQNITRSSTWPTVFAFTLLSSIVLLLFFGVQKVFAGDEPEKGVIAKTFPFVEQLQRQVLKLQESADRIEKTALKIEAGQTEMKSALDGLNEKLDVLTKRLGTMDKNSAAIDKPVTPEDHYFNARLFELRGEAVKARQSYVEYMKGNLRYLDPHLALSALMKAQDGARAAHESYALFVNGSDPAPLLARSLLLERGPRIKALEMLAKDHPDFGPVFYFLSREFSAPETGQQTLENLKNERVAVARMQELVSRGEFAKYFIDKRIALAFESDANQRARKFETMSEAYLDARAKLTILPVAEGWQGIVTVPYDAAEIFVRLPGAKNFQSLGFGADVSPTTGKPSPKSSLSLKGISRGLVAIKYKDNQDKEFGPFEIEFDPSREFVALTKKMMPTTPFELAPVTTWKGETSVMVVQLLMFRAAIKNAYVGPDISRVTTPLRLGATPKDFVVADVQADHPLVSQPIPAGWKNIFLRLEYVDGSTAEVMQLQ